MMQLDVVVWGRLPACIPHFFLVQRDCTYLVFSTTMIFFSYLEIMHDILGGLQNRNIFIWLETPDLKVWIYILPLCVSHLRDSNLCPSPSVFLISRAPDLHLLMNSPDLVITEGETIL